MTRVRFLSGLTQNGRNPCYHIVKNRLRQRVHFSPVPCSKIQDSWLIAAHHANGAYASYRHGKPDALREGAATCNRQNNRQPRDSVEFGGRDHDDLSVSPLLPPDGGI